MNVVIISGPNTVGKGTILNNILEKSSEKVQKVVRYTSRSRGKGEIDGTTYRYVSDHEFEVLLSLGEMAEYTKFRHGYYGTRLKDIVDIVESGHVAILDLDVPSAISLNIKLESMGISSRRYFISPVSSEILNGDNGIHIAIEEIRRRIILRNRGFDIQDEVIAHRLFVARKQLAEHLSYDYLIDNSDGNLNNATEIIISEISPYNDSNYETKI